MKPKKTTKIERRDNFIATRPERDKAMLLEAHPVGMTLNDEKWLVNYFKLRDYLESQQEQ